MKKPLRKDEEYWFGTNKFDSFQYEIDLEEYISDIEDQMEGAIKLISLLEKQVKDMQIEIKHLESGYNQGHNND